MPYDDLKRLAATVGARRGWDFSRVRDDIDPIPWSYRDVARRYLSPLQRVLDVGTGGGEHFLALAEHYGSGIGIDADPEMIAVAEENLHQRESCRVKFLPMDAAALEFPDESFHVVLNHHAPAHLGEIARVLKPGGVFITQQVGARNTANICAAFGCGPGGQYDPPPGQAVAAWAESCADLGLVVRVRGEYDVPYFFRDVESLLFWLMAIPVPEDFDLERHWQQVDALLAATETPRGYATNVHRELLVVQKP
jgi:SAM-dependent methyltransferase